MLWAKKNRATWLYFFIYKCNVGAVDGVIIDFESQELESDNEEVQLPQNAISQEDALLIALGHMGYTLEEIEEFETEYEFDDPIHIYEISFETTTYEYEYEINAITGIIVSYEISEIEN